MPLCAGFERTMFRSYVRTSSSMGTRPKSVGSSASCRALSVITLERFAPAMLSASLRFALGSFPILFLRDALNGLGFRPRWNHIVRVEQMLDRLLLFG